MRSAAGMALSLLLGCALVIASCMLLPLALSKAGWWWLALSCSIALSILLAACYSYWRHIKPFKKLPSGKFEFYDVDADRAAILQGMIGKDADFVKIEQAKVLAIGVAWPPAIRRRTVERYVPNRRTLRQTVSIDVKIPRNVLDSAQPTPLYIPAVISPKGELHDDLQMFGDGGEPVTIVAYRDFIWIAARTIRLLLLTSLGLKIDEQLPRCAERAENSALSTIIKRQKDRSVVADYSGVTAIKCLSGIKNSTTHKLLSAFVEKLITDYVIAVCITVPVNNRCRFAYQLIQIPDMKPARLDSGKRWTLGGFCRLILGVRPIELLLDISNASLSQSYHLHVQCPDDLYLANQSVVGMESILTGDNGKPRQASDAPSRPHFRFRRRLGQSHAHFYVRYMPRLLSNERPGVRFDFFEVPPGSVFRATVTAVACAVIIWLIGFLTSKYHGAADTDAPAFLLAFPALTAAWLGFEAPGPRLLDGTLSARICLIMTVTLSITASALFVAHKSAGSSFAWPELWWGTSLAGVTYIDWAIVVVFSITNAAVIAYKCAIRTWKYSLLLAKERN